jgi:hypothetical protein
MNNHRTHEGSAWLWVIILLAGLLAAGWLVTSWLLMLAAGIAHRVWLPGLPLMSWHAAMILGVFAYVFWAPPAASRVRKK